MRTRIMVMAAAILVAIVGALGGLVVAGYTGTASAKNPDPDPPPGMHGACEKMNHEGMEQMHEGMMNAEGQMGEWMQSGMGGMGQ